MYSKLIHCLGQLIHPFPNIHISKQMLSSFPVFRYLDNEIFANYFFASLNYMPYIFRIFFFFWVSYTLDTSNSVLHRVSNQLIFVEGKDVRRKC